MTVMQGDAPRPNGQVIPVPERISGAACAACGLRGRALCRRVAGSAAHGAHPPRLRRFDRDSTIFERGQTSRPTGVLRRGYLRQETLTRDGDRTLLGLLAPGDLVGWMPDLPGPYTLEAATDAEICVFDARTVGRMMEEDGAARRYVLGEAALQHEARLTLLWQRGALDCRERIVAFLVAALGFMPTTERPDGTEVTIEISRADWADLTNTTVESISRTLGALGRKGLVLSQGRGRYLIRDADALAAEAGVLREDLSPTLA